MKIFDEKEINNMSKTTEKGGISVQTDHIFPIIKKWLYSDKEIFLREIVSNACDAVTKLKRLESLGQYSGDGSAYRINVILDKEEKTLTVSDNGIGMTEEEVKKYICQMALSGALDFIEKYEGENAQGNGIIGHFGLGFYSSFMVSDTVEVMTKSYAGGNAVKWVCSEAGEYEIDTDFEKDGKGTDVVMHITDGEAEFLSASKIKEILEKYCSFMPVEIYFEEIGAEQDSEGEAKEKKPINDIHPLWQKNSSDCTEEEYGEFYKKVFRDYKEPLFHIHLSADYPLNFKGILYFPRLNQQLDGLEGQIKLYYNQVFVADNIKEVIPEYLLMLKGVLDCPELPLNVSRSYLQDSGYVTKISAHITKKVADKLNSLFNTEREKFEELWGELKMFIEYGCIRDRKFYDRVKPSLLLPLTDGSFKTLDEYLEVAKETNENTVYYVSDKSTHSAYINMFNAQNIAVAVYDRFFDVQFMHVVEQDRNIKFTRIDADIASALKGEGEEYDNPALTALFKKVSGKDDLNVKYENLKDTKTPAIINISEESRRFADMMKAYNMENASTYSITESSLIVNASCPLVRKIGEATEGEAAEDAVRYIYSLAVMSQRQLTAEEFGSFMKDSLELLEKSL